jgi:hypothetical protein
MRFPRIENNRNAALRPRTICLIEKVLQNARLDLGFEFRAEWPDVDTSRVWGNSSLAEDPVRAESCPQGFILAVIHRTDSKAFEGAELWTMVSQRSVGPLL